MPYIPPKPNPCNRGSTRATTVPRSVFKSHVPCLRAASENSSPIKSDPTEVHATPTHPESCNISNELRKVRKRTETMEAAALSILIGLDAPEQAIKDGKKLLCISNSNPASFLSADVANYAANDCSCSPTGERKDLLAYYYYTELRSYEAQKALRTAIELRSPGSNQGSSAFW